MRLQLVKAMPATLISIMLMQIVHAAEFIESFPPIEGFLQKETTHIWSGTYLGASLRHGSEESQATGFANLVFDLNGDGFRTLTQPASVSTSHNGFVGGVFAGYNHQFENNIVVGFEVGSERTEWATWLSNAGPRVGFAKDRALLFAEGGLGFQHTNSASAESETFGGYFVGAGVDYALTDRVFVGLKYNHFKFFGGEVNLPASQFNDTGLPFPLSSGSSAVLNFEKYELQTLGLRIGMKF